jgi:hypothetical protein
MSVACSDDVSILFTAMPHLSLSSDDRPLGLHYHVAQAVFSLPFAHVSGVQVNFCPLVCFYSTALFFVFERAVYKNTKPP